MATYINDLRLKEISTGDESGTWGTSTNTNLELIGEALGYATQQVFGSDADATTTVADGASDPARAMYFKITSAGSLTATRTCTIAPNTVSRVMFIENATTGSQSIAISQGSGANVTIATGKTAVVYLDGAGSGAAVVDAMAGVDPGVTDTLAEVLVAGNTSGGTNIELSTTDKVQFRDTGIYINSSADGQLDIVADTEIQIAATTIDINGAINASGEIIAASLDISGDIDVDGTANLDIVDIDGAVDMASTLAVGGVVTANAGIDIDNINIDGTTIALSSGDLTLDVAGDIILDAAGTQVILKKAGTQFGEFLTSSTPDNLYIKSSIQDKDIIFGGNDGGSAITALTLDMSAAGEATFNAGIKLSDGNAASFGAGGDLLVYHSSNENIIQTNTSDQDLLFKGKDGGSTITALTLDMSNAGAATFNGTIAGTRISLSDGVADAGSAGSESVFNNGGTTADFRVESDGNANMLFVDGGANRVGVGTAAPQQVMHLVNGGLQVSGQIISPASGQSAAYFDYSSGGARVWSRGDASTRGTIIFYQLENDGGNQITSLSFDTAGAATFNSTVTIGSNLLAEDIKAKGSGGLTLQTDDGVKRIIIEDDGDVVINETGVSSDFRVESDSNANMLHVDGNNNGVGIGTTGTTTPLTVNGGTATAATIQLGNHGDNAAIHAKYNLAFKADSTEAIADRSIAFSIGTHSAFYSNVAGTVFNEGGANTDFRVESDSNAHMLFVDASTNKVGINASAPEATLDVKTDLAITEEAAANATSQLNFYSRFSDSQRGFVVLKAESLGSGSSDLVINARNSFNDAERLRIASNGDVTFTGNVTGVNDLTIADQIMHTGDTSNYMQFHQADGWRVVNSTGERFHIQGASAVFNHDGHDADFRVESDGDANAIFVDASVDAVVMGNNTQRTTGGFDPKLTVEAGGGTTNACFFRNNLGNAVAGFQVGAITGAANFAIFYNGNGSAIGSIQTSNATAGTTVSYNTSSDARLKENIADADDAGELIDAIQVRQFDWIENDEHQKYGMVAQELQTVAPEAVSAPEDPDEMMGVDYSKLVPMLIKEIQSLRARVADLES